MDASYPNYVDWIKQSSVFEELAGYDGISVTLLGRGVPVRISGVRVTPNFFSLLVFLPYWVATIDLRTRISRPLPLR